MDGQRRKKFIWLVIVQIIVLLAPKSAKFPSYVESVPINYDPNHRVPRASGNLDTSLERLKAVARVTNGIYLAQELINGTDHQEEITSELLRMGSVTPTQISNMDATELEKAVKSIKNVQLKTDDDTMEAELLVKTVVEINEFMKNINDVTVWPGKDSFEAIVNGLKTQCDTVKAALDFKGKATAFENVMTQLATNVASYPLDFLKNHTNDMLSFLEKMKPDDVKFSKTGTALEAFAQPMRTAKFVENIKTGLSTTSQNNVKSNFNNIIAVGQNVKLVASDLPEIEGALKARRAHQVAQRLEYTAGLIGGFEDLESLSRDVYAPWLSQVINASGNLEKSMDALKSLNGPLKMCDTKLGSSNKEQLTAIDTITERSKILGDLNEKTTETNTALKDAFDCPVASTKPGFSRINVLIPLVSQLDQELSTLKDQMIAALGEIEVKKIKEQLEALKKEFDDNPSLPADQMWLKVKEFNGTKLRQPLSELVENDLNFSYKQLRTAAVNLHGNFSNVTDFYTEMATFNKTFNAAKNAKNLELVGKALEVIESIRKDKTSSSSVYDDAVSAVKKVTGTSAELTAVTNAMASLKGKTSSESEHLKLLKEPKKTALNIGRSVQSVVLLNEVFNKMTDIQKVIDNVELINPELSTATGLASEDARQLTDLSGLKTKFEGLKTDLNQWETTVASAEVKELKDASSIYTPAQIVTGIDQDLAPMVSALENLIAIIPNSPNLSKLTALKQSLDTLIMYDLKFSNYQVDKAEADASFDNLQQFFTDFASATNPIPSTARPILTSQRPFTGSTVGTGTAASGEQNKKATLLEWISDNTSLCVIIAIVILVSLVFGTSSVYGWCKKNRKARELERKRNAELEEFIKRMRDQIDDLEKKGREHLAMHIAEGKAEYLATKTAIMEVVVEVVPTDSRVFDILATEGFIKCFYNTVMSVLTDVEKTHKRIQQELAFPEHVKEQNTQIMYHQYHVTVTGMFREEETVANNYLPGFERYSRTGDELVDETRVEISGILPDEMYHVNALGIPGNFKVMAMQAPIGKTPDEPPNKANTCEIMWMAMVQQKVETIVMLTGFVDDDGHRLSAEYFPDKVDEQMHFGGIVVKCLSKTFEQNRAIVLRKLEVKDKSKGGVTLKMNHYHYTCWPTFGRPMNLKPLIWLLRQVDHSSQMLAVHCSDGCRQTAVFTFALCFAQLMPRVPNYKLHGLMMALRSRRARMFKDAKEVAMACHVLIQYMIGDQKSLSPECAQMVEQLTVCYKWMCEEQRMPEVFEKILQLTEEEIEAFQKKREEGISGKKSKKSKELKKKNSKTSKSSKTKKGSKKSSKTKKSSKKKRSKMSKMEKSDQPKKEESSIGVATAYGPSELDCEPPPAPAAPSSTSSVPSAPSVPSKSKEVVKESPTTEEPEKK